MKYAIIVVTALFLITACSDESRVPHMLGLEPSEAEEVASEHGYEVEVIDGYHDSAESGTIFRQIPEPDSELDEGEFLELFVVRYRPVPDVVGMETSEAEDTIHAAGYDVQTVENYFDDADLGTVVEQRPQPGTEHDPDRPVHITVAGEFLTPTISGLFILMSDDRGIRTLADGQCEGDGGYNDIHSRTQVVVRDEAGTLLATSTLGNGELVRSGQCEFEFELPSLPRANFYVFEVGRRGELAYSLQEMENLNWTFGGTLGR
jgi:hypothetical protein